MNIGGHEFKGVVKDVDRISSMEIGVYVVLCLVDDEPHCVLDIGTAEGGAQATVTPTGNLHHRLKRHDRKDCWQENVHGDIGYCVKYVTDDEKRLGLEAELKWKYQHHCGTNPWKEIEEAMRRHKEYEDEFGPRGSYDI